MQRLINIGDSAYKQDHTVYKITHFDEESVYAERISSVAETKLRIDVFNGEVYNHLDFRKNIH